MKKLKRIFSIFAALILMALSVLMPMYALSEEAPTPAVEDVEQIAVAPASTTPYTWEYLATLAGATAATLLIVQFLKVPLDKVWKMPTRLFVYIVSLVILLVATAFTDGLNLQNAPLAVLNAFIVALTAYGAYEVTFAKLNK